jgi:hypothetical protein
MSAQRDLAIVPGFRSDRDVFAWRGLGQQGDLDLAFQSTDRPRLVTQVLAACADPARPEGEEEAPWRLSLAARVGGLIAIHAATTGLDDLPLTLRCPEPDCGEPMEVVLPVPALLDLAREAEQCAETSVDLAASGALRLRRPTGADQRLWRRATYADPSAAEAAVLASLLVDGALDPADQAAAAEALRAFDPLSCFELDVTCPTCRIRADIPVDLEAVLLAALARAQTRLIAQVGRLARRYGWSEAEILAIPDWRRRRYLSLDDDGWPA